MKRLFFRVVKWGLLLIGMLITFFPVLAHAKDLPDSLIIALKEAIHDSTKTMTYISIGQYYRGQHQYDSASNAYHKALEFTDSVGGEKIKALVYYSLGDLLFDWEKYENAIEHAKIAQTRAKNAGDSAQLVDIHYLLGKTHWSLGDISAAFLNYRIALSYADATHNRYRQGVILNGLGTLYWRMADYNKALEYYRNSLDIRVELNDLKGKMLVLDNIGWVLDEWGKHSEALEHYKEAIEITKTIDYPLGEGYTYFSLGNNLRQQLSYDSAIYYYQLGKNTYEASGLGGGVRLCLRDLALTHKEKGELDTASKIYHELLASATKVNDNYKEAEALYGLALIEYERNHLNTAQKYVLQSLEKEKFDKVLILRNRELHSKILEKKSNPQEALIQYKIARALSDSIFNEKKRMQFSLMDAQFKSEKIVGENELLKKDLDLKDVRIKQRGVAIIASIACAIFLVVFVFMLYNGNKNKAELNQKLSKRNYEIENQRLKIEGQNSELTLLNETKDQLLATIGHDIKGPLTSIHAMLRFVNDELISLEEQKEMFGNLEIQVDNVTQMVGNLLDWSKSQLGGFKAFPAEVSVATLVEKQQLLFIPKLKAKKITLEQQFNNCSGAFADLEQLRIVVRNLISNAIKFTEQGGQIVVSCLSENTEVGISIADNGVGMSDEEVIQLLQNKSTSINKPGTDNEKGSGLGLMLSRSLIEGNGGRLEIHSKLGKGSVFTVWIPKAKT